MRHILAVGLLAVCALVGCSDNAGQVKGDDSMEKQLLEAQKNASKEKAPINKEGGPGRVGR
ncbi:MAG: hypothetical protein ACAH95_18685 [Fimbriimonas sp.]